MSGDTYVGMDHAGWVSRAIGAAKKNVKPTARDMRNAAVGRGWFGAPDTLSPFHCKVMDILGMVAGGIYNAPINWDAVDWDFEGGLKVFWRGELATFDFDQLTRLVFLCHAARIRVGIYPGPFGLLRLMFHQRSATGAVWRRHPNLAEAMAAFEDYLPQNHRVRWREPDVVTLTEVAAGGAVDRTLTVSGFVAKDQNQQPAASDG